MPVTFITASCTLLFITSRPTLSLSADLNDLYDQALSRSTTASPRLPFYPI